MPHLRAPQTFEDLRGKPYSLGITQMLGGAIEVRVKCLDI
jgi:hypothetical protein